jgi:predicted TIM-barrel fold metal-dependent hydrolase
VRRRWAGSAPQATAWRLDGEDFATPLLRAAIDLGIRSVAIHKILFLPPAPREAFALEDMGGALDRFPELTFQIVHAGVTYLDQTYALLARHLNLYADDGVGVLLRRHPPGRFRQCARCDVRGCRLRTLDVR